MGEGCMPLGDVLTCDCNVLEAGATPDPKGNTLQSYGDCECARKAGVTDIRLRYLGDATSQSAQTIEIYKGTDTICSFSDVTAGETIICNVLDAVDPTTGESFGYTKFDDTTKMKIIHEDNSECLPQFKTKCEGSFDLVGHDGESSCAELVGTGWSDSTWPEASSAFQCNNGRVPCICGTEVTTTAAPDPSDIPPGDCLCNILTTGSTKYADGYEGYGECGCDKTYGLMQMRLKYIGAQPAKLWEVLVNGDAVCSYTNVAINQTIDCNVRSYRLNGSSVPVYTKFDKNTYFKIVHENDEECFPVFHTSCSSDIVGGTSTDCEEIMCTAWRDGNPIQNECNDGTVWCDCCRQDETCTRNTTACCKIDTICSTRVDGTCDSDLTTTLAATTAAATTGSATTGQGTTGSATTGSGTTGPGTTGSGTTGSVGTTGSGTTGSGTTGSGTTGSGTTGSATTGSGTTGSATTGSATTGSATTRSATIVSGFATSDTGSEDSQQGAPAPQMAEPLSGGAVAGITIGAIVVVAAAAGIGYVVYKQSKRKQQMRTSFGY
eukprot:492459_1